MLQSVQQGNRLEVSTHLNRFKFNGIIQFDKVLSISINDRLPALCKTEDGRYEILVALAASVKSMMGNLNLKFFMNEDQIIELSEQIIDQSYEDQLSLEDVLLFMQKMLTGSYGKLYDRMDIPLFFEFFEKYRQERHEELLKAREAQQAQHKAMGGGDKKYSIKRDRNIDPQTFLELWQTYKDGQDENVD